MTDNEVLDDRSRLRSFRTVRSYVGGNVDGGGLKATHSAVDVDRGIAWFAPGSGGDAAPTVIRIGTKTYERSTPHDVAAGVTTGWVVSDSDAPPRPLPTFADRTALTFVAVLRRIPGRNTATGDGHSDDLPEPATMLRDLRREDGRVKRLGRLRVRGVQTTHYRVTQPIPKYLDGGPPPHEVSRSTVTHLWVDADGVTRRVEHPPPAELALAAELSGVPSAKIPRFATQRIDFFDFGTRVRVAIPPKRDVSPAP